MTGATGPGSARVARYRRCRCCPPACPTASWNRSRPSPGCVVAPAGLPDRLVESVPNVSEGRRLDVVDRLATAIASVDGVHLLDRTSDANHQRAVLSSRAP